MSTEFVEFPDHSGRKLFPGDKVRLGRFDKEIWVVGYNWYNCDGNRPTLGWYLTSINTASPKIKPLQLTDLDDIYLIEH